MDSPPLPAEAAGRDAPPRTVFRKRPVALTVWALAGAAATLQGVLTAGYFAFVGTPRPRELAAVAIGLGFCLALFGLVFLAYAVGRLRGPPDAITVGPEGLHDRAVSARPIPWSDISEVAVAFARGRFLAFNVAAGAEARAGIWPRQQMAAVFERALSYPGYHVHVMGTEADVEGVAEAIARYAPVERRD